MMSLWSAEDYLGSAALPARAAQCQHLQQGSFSAAHAVLSEPGQSCQQVTAFTRYFVQHPRGAEPEQPCINA